MKAATTALEKVRRRVMRTNAALALARPIDRVVHERLLQLRKLLTYSVGDYVWACFGNTRGVQLGRMRVAEPLSFGGPAEWWLVEIYWPTRGNWALGTYRRILRALSPREVSTLRDDGVIP